MSESITEHVTSEHVIHGSDPEMVQLLDALGVPEPETCKRVVLDFDESDFGRMYIERYSLRTKLNIRKIVALKLKLQIVEVTEAKAESE